MEVVKDSAPDSDEENKLLRSLFDRMIQQPRNVKRRYIEELGKIVHPEWTNLKEPLVRQTKGRPKKNAMKRDPSAWEYAEKKYPGKSCKKRSSSGSLHGRRQSRSISSHVRKFPFVNAVPKFVLPFINHYYNVKADGNCGYRSIAYFIYSDEEK